MRRLARVLCTIACIASPFGAHGNDNLEKAMSGVSNGKAPPPPNVAIGERGLHFRLAMVGGEHPTGIVLHGKYVLGQPYFHLYGGQLKAAIRIVAIAQATGQVFTGFPTPPDTNPIVMPENDEPNPDPTVAPLVSVSGTFEVDLREQLRLPETAGDYAIFLWLDDVVTPPQMAHLPGTDPGDMPVPLPPRHVILSAPPAGEAGPSPAHGAIGLAVGAGRVTVVLPEEQVSAPRQPGAHPVWLTVFVQAHRRHVLAWQSESLASALEISPRGTLSFELLQLIARPDEPEKLFLVAAVGGGLSRIVVVPRQNPRTNP